MAKQKTKTQLLEELMKEIEDDISPELSGTGAKYSTKSARDSYAASRITNFVKSAEARAVAKSMPLIEKIIAARVSEELKNLPQVIQHILGETHD